MGKIPHPGLRNIKTGITVGLLFTLYRFLFPDSWGQGAMLASMTAVVCMQDSVDKTLRSGVNRMTGTAIGAALGCLVAALNLGRINYFLWLAVGILMMVALIYVFTLLHKTESLVIGCMVYIMIILGTTAGSPVQYSVARLADTVVGIALAAAVNRWVFAPKPSRLIYKKSGSSVEGMNCEIRRAGGHRRMRHGNITELYTYPENAVWADMGWGFSLFLETRAAGNHALEKFDGYKRRLMVLDGEAALTHEGQYAKRVRRFEWDFFKGEWTTAARGAGTDINLVSADAYEGKLDVVRNREEKPFPNPEGAGELFKVGLYFLADEVKVSLKLKEGGAVMFNNTFRQGDFLIIDEPKNHAAGDFLLAFDQARGGDQAVAVLAGVARVC